MSLVERPYVLTKVRNLKATQKNHLYLNITSYYYFIQFITTTRLRSSKSRFQRVKTDFRLNRKDAMFVGSHLRLHVNLQILTWNEQSVGSCWFLPEWRRWSARMLQRSVFRTTTVTSREFTHCKKCSCVLSKKRN